jgi:hypothetical protein
MNADIYPHKPAYRPHSLPWGVPQSGYKPVGDIARTGNSGRSLSVFRL